MAELTYDQFSGHGDLTEMASQINAALEKITDRIDKLDDGGSKLLDPTSQGIAVNLADGFGRNLEAYLNNPNKRMLGDWILEGTLVVDGPLTVNGLSTIVGDQTISGNQTIAGTFRTSASGRRIEIVDDVASGDINFYSGQTGETAAGFITSVDGDDGRDYILIRPSAYSPSGGWASEVILWGQYGIGGGLDTLTQITGDTLSLIGGTNKVSITGGTGVDINAGSGNVAVTGAVQASNGSASTPSHSFNGDTNTGMYRKSSDKLGFSTAGVERAYLDSGGLYLASGDWFRSTGSVGWFNQTYGGGWHMTDSTWVRTFNGKGILTSGGIAAGLSAITSTSGYNYVMRNATYTSFAYYTSSRKFKENIVEVVPSASGAWMDALQPVMFNERWLGEGDEPADSKAWREADVQVGFIAEDVLSDATTSQFSQVKDADGELEAVGWKWECVIAASVAEIKSLRSRLTVAEDSNESLEQRLSKLETKAT